MIKIHYKPINLITGRDATIPCPNGKKAHKDDLYSVAVGSVGCYGCKHFKEVDYGKSEVHCLYDENGPQESDKF